MAKYHINPTTGNVGVCKAKHQCRFGGEHFDSKKDALAYGERILSSETNVKEVAQPEGLYNVSAPEIGVYFTDTFTSFNEKSETLANDWASLRESHQKLKDWKLIITSYSIGKTRSVAFTRPTEKMLVVDDRWVNALEEKDIKDIMAHEIAHILVDSTHGENSHGKEWKESFQEIGGSGDEIMNEESTARGLEIIHKEAEKWGYPPLAGYYEKD
jgi:hypothetical protein